MIQIDLTGGRLTGEQIAKLIREHKADRYLDNLEYYKGENPAIMRRVFAETQAPHNKIPSAYGRKIVKTVAGYMYQPGLINYVIPDGSYKTKMEDIFYVNREPLKTHQMGVQSSLQGVGYELHYTNGTEPRFAQIPAASTIPVYSFDIEPVLEAAIRFVRRDPERVMIDVYYPLEVERWVLKAREEQESHREVEFLGAEAHNYDMVPLVVYRNNDEEVGDFEPVQHIIDAYDVLMSDSMNEFDRFSFAYLVLKGMRMTRDEAEKMKQLRVFQGMDETGDVKFLTKEIPHEFIQFMADKFNRAIYSFTGVPDLTDDRVLTGDMSGKAMKLMFHNFEVMAAATKEANFKEGLYRRFSLINSVLSRIDGSMPDIREIEIVMNRNQRADMLELAETLEKYSGHISERTALEQFAPFVQDVDEELELIKQEREEKMSLIDFEEPEDGDTERREPAPAQRGIGDEGADR